MTLVKYILLGLINALCLGLGGDIGLNSDNYSKKEYFTIIIIGVATLFILGLIFLFFALKVFKKKKFNVLWAFLITIGILIIFCLICILVEWLIKL